MATLNQMVREFEAVLKSAPHPLRKIVARPSNTTEALECGHTIQRPLSLGEFAFNPSKAKRRRCYLCAKEA